MEHPSRHNSEEHKPKPQGSSKQSNVLSFAGNERTMNLNPLILTNIQSSHYFKVNLYELKTYHEVVDEIYYKVNHLEPWEKGSRRTAGQTGMCGGVRGVGAGGIVSTAYCLLYKLFTLKLTRKQLNGLLNHCDSPFIRALGFMYIRYVLPPKDLLHWYEPYLDDEEELDVKAGGGQVITIGTMLKQWLVNLEWFSTLFPRIPVPIQQQIQKRLLEIGRNVLTKNYDEGSRSGKRDSNKQMDSNSGQQRNLERREDVSSSRNRDRRGDNYDEKRFRDRSPHRDRSDESSHRHRNNHEKYPADKHSSYRYHR